MTQRDHRQTAVPIVYHNVGESTVAVQQVLSIAGCDERLREACRSAGPSCNEMAIAPVVKIDGASGLERSGLMPPSLDG
jgi:hypothetical protein